MARTLVLLRHGRTAYNHEGRLQGQVDVELDEAGHEQAARAAAEVARLDPAVLWCSDLVRTRSTASYLERETGLSARPDARLREFHLGRREGLTYAEYAEQAPEESERFLRGDVDAVVDGERTATVGERMAAAVADLLAATPEDGVAVAVSHGAPIRVATATLQGWPAGSDRGLHGLDNCGWVVMDDSRLDPSAPFRLRLRAYNRVAATP